MITIVGKLIDVGMLPDGRGMQLEVAGQEVVLTGLTEIECREIAPSLGKLFTIDVRLHPASTPNRSTGETT